MADAPPPLVVAEGVQWRPHFGGPMPCAPGCAVVVWLRVGKEAWGDAGVFRWNHEDSPGDITAWQPLQ